MIIIYSVNLFSQERITLLFVGDLMQHEGQIRAARITNGGYDYSSNFSLVKNRIEKADIAIANLEVTLGGEPYTGYPRFSAPDEYLKAIKDAGFDILLTANNHCLDSGKKGLERTIVMLDSLHIPHVGTYKNQKERLANYPLLIEKEGFRIVLLNYTYATNGILVSEPNVVNYIDKSSMSQDIQMAKSWHPDAIIACMHWGVEYQSLPNNEQRKLADWLLQQGVTHVIGSHPHVIQPMELRRDSVDGTRHVVVYSLGNFISNMSKENTDGGLIFTLVLEKKTFFPESSTSLYKCGYNLVWTARPLFTKRENFILYPVDYADLSSLHGDGRNHLKIFTKNARLLLQKHNIGIGELEESQNQE